MDEALAAAYREAFGGEPSAGAWTSLFAARAASNDGATTESVPHGVTPDHTIGTMVRSAAPAAADGDGEPLAASTTTAAPVSSKLDNPKILTGRRRATGRVTVVGVAAIGLTVGAFALRAARRSPEPPSELREAVSTLASLRPPAAPPVKANSNQSASEAMPPSTPEPSQATAQRVVPVLAAESASPTPRPTMTSPRTSVDTSSARTRARVPGADAAAPVPASSSPNVPRNPLNIELQ
jgi:hypothetical protein